MRTCFWGAAVLGLLSGCAAVTRPPDVHLPPAAPSRVAEPTIAVASVVAVPAAKPQPVVRVLGPETQSAVGAARVAEAQPVVRVLGVAAPQPGSAKEQPVVRVLGFAETQPASCEESPAVGVRGDVEPQPVRVPSIAKPVPVVSVGPVENSPLVAKPMPVAQARPVGEAASASEAPAEAEPAAAEPAAEVAPEISEPIPFIPHDGLWGAMTPRFSLEYFNGPGFGYYTGYTTFDAFVPIFGSSLNHLVYADLRGIVSDSDQQWGNNVGLGYRFYHPPLDRIFGAWTSWDLRDTNFATYNQVSAGVETFGRYLDFRSNGYAVLGTQTAVTGRTVVSAPFFQGNNVMFPVLVKFDAALSGTDMELGGPVPYLGRYGIRAYAGGYVFHNDAVGTFGGAQGRLVARLSNNVDFNLTLRDDQLFGTTLAFGGAVRWGGLRRALREPNSGAVYNRMADPVLRNYNVAVLDPIKTESTPATDPNTGQPVRIVHVDNQASAGGDGSVERPLNVLAPAPGVAGAYGIILVQRGDGTTMGLNNGVVLTSGQRLLGNSMAYTFATREFGMLTLPNTPNGIPTLTSSGGPAVVLANGVEVAGMQIVDAGIAGSGVRDFNINHMNLNGGGIAVTNATGTGTIQNTIVTGNGCDGVAIGTAGNGTLVLALAKNDFSGNDGHGLALTALDASAMTANINGGSFNNNGGTGITARSSAASTLTLTLTGTTIENNAAGGVVFTAGDQSNASLTMNGNTLTNNGTATVGDGVRVISTTAGTFAAQIMGNRIENSGLTGVDLVSAGGTFLGTVANNTVTGSGANGIALVASAGSATVNVHDNTIADSGAVGLVLTRSGVPYQSESETSSLPALTASAWNNTITGSTRQGIYVADISVFNAPPTPFTVNLTNNHTSGNRGAGISLMSLSAFGNSNLIAHVEGNTLDGDNAGGIDSGAFQAMVQGVMAPASLGLRLTGNTANPAQGNAFHLSNTGGTFLFQDGGQNLPSTFTQVGTITPGIVP